MTKSDAQDLRITLTTSQQPQQQQQTLTDQPPSRLTLPANSAPPPPPPPFGLGLIAIGPHTSFGSVPTAPGSDTVSADGGAALNVPIIRPSQSATTTTGVAGGGPIRRRVSDKTSFPISTGNAYR